MIPREKAVNDNTPIDPFLEQELQELEESEYLTMQILASEVLDEDYVCVAEDYEMADIWKP